MPRFDALRVSLLTALTACGPAGIGSSSDSDADAGPSDAESGADTDTETGVEECPGVCDGAVIIADGVARCADGALNRVGPGSFDPTIDAAACVGDEDYLNCTSDAECTAGGPAKCAHGDKPDDEWGEAASWCSCVYSCASDSDCEAGMVCVPPGLVPGTPAWPSCRWADCTSDEDCGPCGECGLGAHDDGCGWVVELACRTEADECHTTEDCLHGDCFPSSPSGWVCTDSSCNVGRPLLVDALARTAPSHSRRDWTATLEHAFAGLGDDPELAAHWATIAALEHASVASFARFGLQLLALGAGPELLLATQQAARDEVEHAKLAYALASAYGAGPIGPGPLNLAGLRVATSWRDVVRGLIEEACVGETLGVAEAMAAAETVTNPVVRAVLDRIIADELRHAQLAWRTLAWLLREADPRERRWAIALLNRTIAGMVAPRGGLDRPADGALGGLGRADVHREATAQVLEPLARAVS